MNHPLKEQFIKEAKPVADNSHDAEWVYNFAMKCIDGLLKENELYSSLQDSDCNRFVFLDGMPDRPWTDEEVAIIDRHNARFAGQFRKTEDGKLEFIDGIGRITEVKTSVVGDPVEFILTPAFSEKSASFNPGSEQSETPN